MWKSIEAFCADESGASAMEYAFVAALVSVVAVVFWTSMGDTLNTGYTLVSDSMTNAVSGTGSEQTFVGTTTASADTSSSPTLR